MPAQTEQKPSEAAHANQREVLEHALAAEKQTIANHGERIRQAEALGDSGLRLAPSADESQRKG